MAKCVICEQDKEDYTEKYFSIFHVYENGERKPMCKECYGKFLDKNWNEIWNAVMEYCIK